MIKTYKVEVFFQDVDLELFNKSCGVKRFLYNMFIATNKLRYEREEKYMNSSEFSKWLNNSFIPNNPEYKWIKEVSSKNNKNAIMIADKSYKDFMKGLRSFPKYKKRSSKVSFYFIKDGIKIERHRIWIPIFKWLRLKEFGYIDKIDVNKIMSGNLVREADKFYVCLRVNIEEEIKTENTIPKTEGIGVDLGLLNFATVSNGTIFKRLNKRYLRILERRKKHLQKELMRRLKKTKSKKQRLEKQKEKEKYKQLYKENKLNNNKIINNKIINKEETTPKENKTNTSKNAIKTINKLQKVESKIKRIRKGYITYVVNSMVKQNPQFITIENLNIRGMLKNRHLSKKVSESNFYYFREFLSYRCNKLDIELRIANRFYPSSKLCSNCNHKKEDLKLKDRIYKCNNCGFEIDRDFNASINLRNYRVV